MKQIFYTFLYLFPVVTLAQVSMDKLIRKNGLTYEQDASNPFTGKAIEYFSNGAIKTILAYKNGIPDGEIKSWYSKDVKKAEGYFENGQRTGTWRLYYENGSLKNSQLTKTTWKMEKKYSGQKKEKYKRKEITLMEN